MHTGVRWDHSPRPRQTLRTKGGYPVTRHEHCGALLVAATLGAAAAHGASAETVEHEGRRYRVYLVAVVYTSG